jgi:hypothetical protein
MTMRRADGADHVLTELSAGTFCTLIAASALADTRHSIAAGATWHIWVNVK